ncbi:hypothetical protein EVAR_12834_1 [Eumeta japonica]|uniref:Uncharacterized protein n=1 Tax=Eumeta variegata TaxID=151549 RepID=A0A4C1UAX6_EUMVA|nr:hypothetical protein EVAR_12834_1 [Eumeta japonica]
MQLRSLTQLQRKRGTLTLFSRSTELAPGLKLRHVHRTAPPRATLGNFRAAVVSTLWKHLRSTAPPTVSRPPPIDPDDSSLTLPVVVAAVLWEQNVHPFELDYCGRSSASILRNSPGSLASDGRRAEQSLRYSASGGW